MATTQQEHLKIEQLQHASADELEHIFLAREGSPPSRARKMCARPSRRHLIIVAM
jgi:hypothetical protein